MKHRVSSRQERPMRRRDRMGLREYNWTQLGEPSRVETGDPRLEPIVITPDPTRGGEQDQWTWPYPPAQFNNWYLNGWDGDQLPGWFKIPSEDSEWVGSWVQTTSQQWSEYQRSDGPAVTGMSQDETVSVVGRMMQAWQSFAFRGSNFS